MLCDGKWKLKPVDEFQAGIIFFCSFALFILLRLSGMQVKGKVNSQ